MALNECRFVGCHDERYLYYPWCRNHYRMIPPAQARKLMDLRFMEREYKIQLAHCEDLIAEGLASRHEREANAHEKALGFDQADREKELDYVLVTGNTFPVRDQLKAWGSRWDAAARGWMVPRPYVMAARALVSQEQAEVLPGMEDIL